MSSEAGSGITRHVTKMGGEQNMSIAPAALINVEPVANQVTEVLRQWILSGRLAAGQHIRQEAIAAELGVSRVPVREALFALETEGLLLRQKYKGAFVAEISLPEIRETYLLRDALESLLFEQALPHITEDHLRRAEEIIRRSVHAATPEDWMRLNIEFHTTLYEPAQLKRTMQMLHGLLRHTDRYFRLQQAISPTLHGTSQQQQQHQHIVDVIRSGDGQAALQSMRQHIRGNADEVIEYLENLQLREQAANPHA